MNIGGYLHTLKRIWSKRSPESWLNYLRSEGMRTGTGTKHGIPVDYEKEQEQSCFQSRQPF